MKRILILSLIAVMAATVSISAKESGRKALMPGEFKASDGSLLLNGKPFVVKAAELHYPRIPRPYWEHRIRLCKALGMNTICLYTFWNIHEPRPGDFDFTGQNDLREFIGLCEKHEMKVILRPGPYVCAEWEMGGLPWWLLRKKDIRLRENDPYFLQRVDTFQKAVAEQVADLTIDKGGPVIMIQVENEYGSYGTDKPYISNIRDMLRRYYGDTITLFQCDWSSNFTENGLDDLLWTMNFGTGADIDAQFSRLRELRPDSPLICSEFWSGWFDKWGASHETRSADSMIEGIGEMLDKNMSFSLYMTHGGTNWGHWAGANSPGYAPDVTSYDYDAPINEQGRPTDKYFKLRKLMEQYHNGKLPSIPSAIPTTSIPRFRFTHVAPLFNNLPEPIISRETLTIEDCDYGFGSILYRTSLPTLSAGSILKISEPHDYAQIFIDGKYAGTLDRRMSETELSLPAVDSGATLDILVEATGRINFGRAIKDFKGITENVSVTEQRGDHTFTCILHDWRIYPLEDTPAYYDSLVYEPLDSFSVADNGRLPRGAYKGTFVVNKPADTFLDFSTWGKGLVYVNGHPLGRIWDIGPQQTLYMPGCWLRKGVNEIMVYDVAGPRDAVSQGCTKPELNKLQLPHSSKHYTAADTPSLVGLTSALSATPAPGNGWQRFMLEKISTGRYMILEAIEALDGGDIAAVAEIYLLDENGKRISREPWKVIYADSEDTEGGNRLADKTFDLQESTYWQTCAQDKFPHTIVIDLGMTHTVRAIEYLPRMESDTPGAIARFNLYITGVSPLDR